MTPDSSSWRRALKDPPQRQATAWEPGTAPASVALLPLRAHGITVAYGDQPALWNADLEAPAGTMTAIVGPNGAGKSTLLKACLGLVRPLSGRTTFFGQHLARARKRIALMPQRQEVDWDFPVTARDVVIMGLESRMSWWWRPGFKHRAVEAAVDAQLDRVGLLDKADAPIGALSGGQQQRLFLARALAREPELLLADEPFAGVDAQSAGLLLEAMQRVTATGGAVVCVHHDLPMVAKHFDRAVVLDTRLVAAGPVAAVMRRDVLGPVFGPDAVAWAPAN